MSQRLLFCIHITTMLNILINAYAVSPNWGSEQGMGWNWIANLAKYCNVFVITEGEFREHIKAAVAELPQGKNMHFYYNPQPDKVRKMCWNQGDWRFYWYYRKWQKKTLKIAEQIIAENRIDIIHQLNMIGFREPGYLWKIERIPFVWGPIGGMDLMPVSYLHGAGWKTYMKNKLKNVINSWQMYHQPRVLKAIGRADYLIAATGRAYNVLHDYHFKNNVVLINETGCNTQFITHQTTFFNNECFNILWVGKFDFRKQLGLALKAVAATNNKHIYIHICGKGEENAEKLMRQQADTEGITAQVYWHGNVDHDKIFGMMKNADLFFFTSIMEATSTVVLEAISTGLPVLCFNTCGFGPLVKEFAGETIELSDPETSIREFTEKINMLYHDRDRLETIRRQEMANRERLSWDSKARETVEIYQACKKDD